MSGTDSESIRVAEVSEGPCESGRAGAPVELPVVEVLTGRGLITGKSGSGKSNTASVVSEKLLDSGFGLLVVDIDGEYYGLKEEYEILHAGADEECDIQVTVDHAEKLASLALEGNVPIILDVSSFLDESEARELLTAVSKHLFAKAKKRKQPFLLLVEEVHEYIPENGSVGECGKMLIKIGKRGRKHGLGIVGISQRPADVKKDFITQCDWLVWHRLTWKNDTKVVRRIIDKEHSEAVEDLDDGEAFLMTDWAGTVRRVQFQRKRTFDAGATPGLDDFERPELKSVSEDLVAELQEISEEERERENRIEQLREELDRKNSRIAELEAELSDARDMQRMARQFTNALVEHVERANPGVTEQERTRRRRARTNGERAGDTRGEDVGGPGPGPDGSGPEHREEDGTYATTAMTWPGEDDDRDWGSSDGTVDAGSGSSDDAADDGSGSSDDAADDGFGLPDLDDLPDGITDGESGIDGREPGDSGPFTAETGDSPGGDDGLFGTVGAGDGSGDRGRSDGRGGDDAGVTGPGTPPTSQSVDGPPPDGEADALTRGFTAVEGNPLGDRATDAFARGETPGAIDAADVGEFTRLLGAEIAELDSRTRGMLRYYRDHGPGTPMEALFSAGGPADSDDSAASDPDERTGTAASDPDERTEAYARNRRLRVRGLIEHVGRGNYAYRVPDLVREYADHRQVGPYVDRIEGALGPRSEDGPEGRGGGTQSGAD